MASRIVLISGCSSGIGLATAVLLAKDPEKRFKVYATMRNLTSKGQLEEEGKEHLGDTLMIKQMDVCSDESVNKAVQEVISEEGRIDVLFNNAGMPLFSILECIPMEMIRELFEVNYFGTLRLIRAVLPCMKARESGHIINCSSHAGIVGFPFADIYTSSKFAVEGLTESLAPVLREFNIRCTIIEPGPVDTPMVVNLVNTTGIDLSTTDPKTREIKKRVDSTFSGLCLLEGGMITAQDVAEVVKESLLSQKPALRYQTNKSFCPDEVAAKLTDISGNKSVDIIAKRYCEEGQ